MNSKTEIVGVAILVVLVGVITISCSSAPSQLEQPSGPYAQCVDNVLKEAEDCLLAGGSDCKAKGQRALDDCLPLENGIQTEGGVAAAPAQLEQPAVDPYAQCVENALKEAETCLLSGGSDCKAKGERALGACEGSQITGYAVAGPSRAGGSDMFNSLVGLLAVIAVLVLIVVKKK